MKTVRRTASTPTLLVLLFAASVYLAAFVFNPAPRSTNKLIQFSLCIALYFAFRLLFQTFRKNRRSVQTLCGLILLLLSLIEAICGLRQLYGFSLSQHNLFRMTGSFFNPGPYAGFLAVIFSMALYYGLKKAVWIKVLAIGVCVAILLVLPDTWSRASWLAVLAGSALVVWGSGAIKIRLPRRFLTFFVVMLLAGGLTGIYFLKKDSADGRLLIWKINLKTLVQNPLGVGLGHFSGAYGDTQAAYFASGEASETEKLVAGNPEYGFNEFLQIGIESGVAALLLFIGILLKAFYLLKRNGDWGEMGSLAALVVFACFSYPFSLWPFLVVLTYLLAVGGSFAHATTPVAHATASVAHATTPVAHAITPVAHATASVAHAITSVAHATTPVAHAITPVAHATTSVAHATTSVAHATTSVAHAINWMGKARFLAICLIVGVLGFGFYRQYPVYRASKQWNVLRSYYHSKLYDEVIENYEPLYPYLNDRVEFLFEYAQSLSKSGKPAESNAALQRATQISCDPMLYNILGKNYQAMKEYEAAETAFLHAAHLVPNRLYPWYLLTKLYDEMGLPQKASEAAQKVWTTEPKVQSPAIKEMRREVQPYLLPVLQRKQ
jgi:O-antigen ligase